MLWIKGPVVFSNLSFSHAFTWLLMQKISFLAEIMFLLLYIRCCNDLNYFSSFDTVQKMKFCIKYFFSKCDQILSFLQIWSHLVKKSLMENFILCVVWISFHCFFNFVCKGKFQSQLKNALVFARCNSACGAGTPSLIGSIQYYYLLFVISNTIPF